MKTQEQIRQMLDENKRARAYVAELAAMSGATDKQIEAFKIADQAFVSASAMLYWVLDADSPTDPA